MSQLTLFWGNKEDTSFYWKISQNATSDESQQATHQLESKEILKADLACVADMAASSNVTLVLSCRDVVNGQLEVPNKAQKLLRKAVPYMMEDEIATSVDELFFALADKSENSRLNVRAIDRNYLDSLLEQFSEAEIKLSQVVIDIDLVSRPEDGLTMVLMNDQCLVVDQDNNRWHCHQDDFNWLIQKQLSDLESEQDMPIAIPMQIVAQQETDRFIHALPVGRFAIEQTASEDINDYLLNNTNRPLNLLQAEYEPQKESSQLMSFIQKVATLAGIILLSHLVFQGANIYTLSETKEQLEKQKVTLFKQAFPGNKNVRRPEKDMRIYVKSLGGASGDGGFLSLLYSTSESLTDLTKIYPTNISYDRARNELRVDVIASDLVVLDQYSAELRGKGHTVEKSSETQRGDGYSSRLTISK